MKMSGFIAGVFGTIGFVVSLFAGLIANNSVDSILWKALLSAIACYAVGYGVGLIGQQVSAEHAAMLAQKVAREDAAAEQARLEAAAEEAAPTASPEHAAGPAGMAPAR